MKEKSIDEREISNWFLLTIKQGKKGSNAAPLETLVPFSKGLIKDLTYNGISFFCKGCNVFGWITVAP